MRKIVFVLLLIASNVFTNLQAQQVAEPEFIGEVYLVDTNKGTTPLPKHLIQNKVNVPATLLIGVGRAKNNLVIEGCCSDVVVPEGKPVVLVVKNVDNLSDPLAVIKIFKFKKNKKNRTAEVSSANLWGSVKKNSLDYVPFTAKKFGESSYLVTITDLKEGEYGISVVNPNALDQKEVVVSTFAVK